VTDWGCVAESVECPKCGAESTAPACPRCGLARDKMAAFVSARAASVPEAISSAWQALQPAWDDQKRHDAIFELAARLDALAWLGGKYRERAKTDDAMAVKQLEKVRKAAEATLFATASPRDDQRKRNSLLALGVMAVVLAIIAAAVYFTAGDKKPPPAPAAPRAQTR